jgi:hypothetical protein
MDLRHSCHLIAETLTLAAGNLLGEDARTVQARVSSLGPEFRVVHLWVDYREFELVVRERKRRPVPPCDQAGAEEGNSK